MIFWKISWSAPKLYWTSVCHHTTVKCLYDGHLASYEADIAFICFPSFQTEETFWGIVTLNIWQCRWDAIVGRMAFVSQFFTFPPSKFDRSNDRSDGCEFSKVVHARCCRAPGVFAGMSHGLMPAMMFKSLMGILPDLNWLQWFFCCSDCEPQVQAPVCRALQRVACASKTGWGNLVISNFDPTKGTPPDRWLVL